MKWIHNPLIWGVIALSMLMVTAIVAGYVYIRPPGDRQVVFYTNDAASVRSGDSVRVAGIPVGKITSLSLEQDRIRVQASVDKNTFVGDQSQVDIRMLTIVGGYYVDLIPLGDRPLGENPIPAGRVKTPYNLMRALTDSTKVTQEINPRPIRQSLDQIQAGLSGTNTETLSTVIDAGNALADTIDRQRGQITQILDMSDEYIQALSAYRGRLQELVSKISIIEQTLTVYGKGFGAALAGMGDIGESVLAPLSKFWVNNREEFIQKVRDWQDRFRRWVDNNSRIIPRLRRVRDKIERVLDAQNAKPELLATDLCIPVPGSVC
ncbi:MlaD family protein [Mycolicibacterium anyangense]|uniref:MlaD family protein n=1 Tax=Mycolicibacterium anyangense TaxID=1431246 RepID=UPI0038991D89